MKLLGKLKKAKAVKECKCCDKSVKQDYKPNMYKVRVILPKTTWNEEIKKYIFVNPINRKALIVESQEVEFESTSEIWRFLDTANEFESITIEPVK